MSSFALGAAVIGVLGLTAAAVAQTTTPAARRTIPYQGTLVLGTDVVDGAIDFELRLYDAPVGGDALWSEQQSLAVVRGAFSTTLGAATPLPDAAFVAEALFLEIAVEGVALQGRQQVFAVPYAVRANNGAPPGTITAFAGPTTNLPAGWLLCDGAVVSAAAYPELAAALGASWGDGGDGDGPLFSLPDARGRFPRGVDDGVARDPDRAARAANAGGGNAGDAVGTIQDDAFQGHRHAATTNTVAGANVHPAGTIEWVNAENNGTPGFRDIYEGPRTLEVLDPTSAGAFGGARPSQETRPENFAVHWIIKI